MPFYDSKRIRLYLRWQGYTGLFLSMCIFLFSIGYYLAAKIEFFTESFPLSDNSSLTIFYRKKSLFSQDEKFYISHRNGPGFSWSAPQLYIGNCRATSIYREDIYVFHDDGSLSIYREGEGRIKRITFPFSWNVTASVLFQGSLMVFGSDNENHLKGASFTSKEEWKDIPLRTPCSGPILYLTALEHKDSVYLIWAERVSKGLDLHFIKSIHDKWEYGGAIPVDPSTRSLSALSHEGRIFIFFLCTDPENRGKSILFSQHLTEDGILLSRSLIPIPKRFPYGQLRIFGISSCSFDGNVRLFIGFLGSLKSITTMDPEKGVWSHPENIDGINVTSEIMIGVWFYILFLLSILIVVAGFFLYRVKYTYKTTGKLYPASVVARGLAFSLDIIILFPIWLGVCYILFPQLELKQVYTGFLSNQTTFLSILVFQGLHSIYFILCEIWRGQTLGKKILNIRVVSENGTSLRIWPGIIRNILRFVDAYFFIGALVILISPKSQRLGDILGHTMVVQIS